MPHHLSARSREIHCRSDWRYWTAPHGRDFSDHAARRSDTL